MSVSGILSSSLIPNNQLMQNRLQFPVKFQQLGQDLQSGNLAAAQSDFATLQQLQPQGVTTSSAQSSSPLAQEINQLSQDLQSGNLTAAQKDVETIQQNFQSKAPHLHHRHGGTSQVSQLFSDLSDSLQAGNLSAAQQAYSTLAQDLQQYGGLNGEGAAVASATGVSVTA